MISIYKKTDEGLMEVDTIEKDCWVNAIQPNYLELNEISKALDIPEEFLTDPLDLDERPRVEAEGDNILIILRVPCFDKNHPEIQYNTLPLGIIYSPDNIITISSMESEILSMFAERRIKNFSPSNKIRFIFLILLKTATLYLKFLRQISNLTTDHEKELHKTMKNVELLRLMDLEKSLVYFTTSLKANEIMIGRLSVSKHINMSPEDRDLLEDVIVEYKQAIEMAHVHSNILGGMMQSFASLISNNLNASMKSLTSITIVLMLPTLVASIYGMNVVLPGGMERSNPHTFFLLLLIMGLISTVMLIVFRYKHWI